MCGLIPTWKNFMDETNSVSRPSQIGPMWHEAAKVSDMPIDSTVWHRTPPRSSFPSCIAVKSAFLQSALAGELYLRLIRERWFILGEDISSAFVLQRAARELSNYVESFDVDVFDKQFTGEVGQEAFREDWIETKASMIRRVPTISIKRDGNESKVLSGYVNFKMLRAAFIELNPHIASVELCRSIDEYRRFWKFVNETEANKFIECEPGL
jgi:putative protein-disulfide isomerase